MKLRPILKDSNAVVSNIDLLISVVSVAVVIMMGLQAASTMFTPQQATINNAEKNWMAGSVLETLVSQPGSNTEGGQDWQSDPDSMTYLGLAVEQGQYSPGGNSGSDGNNNPSSLEGLVIDDLYAEPYYVVPPQTVKISFSVKNVDDITIYGFEYTIAIDGGTPCIPNGINHFEFAPNAVYDTSEFITIPSGKSPGQSYDITVTIYSIGRVDQYDSWTTQLYYQGTPLPPPGYTPPTIETVSATISDGNVEFKGRVTNLGSETGGIYVNFNYYYNGDSHIRPKNTTQSLVTSASTSIPFEWTFDLSLVCGNITYTCLSQAYCPVRLCTIPAPSPQSKNFNKTCYTPPTLSVKTLTGGWDGWMHEFFADGELTGMGTNSEVLCYFTYSVWKTKVSNDVLGEKIITDEKTSYARMNSTGYFHSTIDLYPYNVGSAPMVKFQAHAYGVDTKLTVNGNESTYDVDLLFPGINTKPASYFDHPLGNKDTYLTCTVYNLFATEPYSYMFQWTNTSGGFGTIPWMPVLGDAKGPDHTLLNPAYIYFKFPVYDEGYYFYTAYLRVDRTNVQSGGGVQTFTIGTPNVKLGLITCDARLDPDTPYPNGTYKVKFLGKIWVKPTDICVTTSKCGFNLTINGITTSISGSAWTTLDNLIWEFTATKYIPSGTKVDYYAWVKPGKTGCSGFWSTVHGTVLTLYLDVGLPPPTCFLADTKIAMADNSLKNIQDIKIGDMVKAFDEKTREWKNAPVTKVFHHPSNEMTDYYLVINNELKVTPNHILYVDNKWITAGELKIGDHFGNGVKSIEKVFEKVPTYNFEVDVYHNYKVVWGSTDAIAHNMNQGQEENIAESRKNACFLADTKVTMADNSLKNIQDIKIGDSVQAYDEKNGEWKNASVIDVYHHTPSEMTDYYLVINNDVRVTPNHLLYSNGKWMEAGDFKVGDYIGNIIITSIEKVWERTYTYNLEVETYHNYNVVFNSKESMTVHNQYIPAIIAPPQDPNNRIPTAKANGPYTGKVGETITIIGGGHDNDVDEGAYTIEGYKWTIPGNDDTGFSMLNRVRKLTFSTADVYTIYLRVIDNEGSKSSLSDPLSTTTITIEGTYYPPPPPPANTPPTANAGGPYTGVVRTAVKFDGSNSTAASGRTISEYSWNFGDGGTPGTEAKPPHTYTKAGVYTVTLTVTDNSLDELTGSDTVNAYIYDATPPNYFSTGSEGAYSSSAEERYPLLSLEKINALKNNLNDLAGYNAVKKALGLEHDFGISIMSMDKQNYLDYHIKEDVPVIERYNLVVIVYGDTDQTETLSYISVEIYG